MKKILTGILLISAAISCSVLEDRTPCPGVLVVNTADIRSRMGAGTLRLDLISADGATVISRLVNAASADTLQFVVRKTDYTVCSAAGQENTNFSFAGTAYGSLGRQSDTVYAFSDRLTVSGETTEYDCLYHKQFATVRIVNSFVSGVEDSFEGMILRVSSAYGALRYQDMTAVAGDFYCTVRSGADGAYMFRMPRQGDASIMLEVSSPEFTHRVPIGRYLQDMGYDFDALDMEDVTVGVDLVSMTVSVMVEGWSWKKVYAII